jgi:uncharacterized protein (DUF1330 family)
MEKAMSDDHVHMLNVLWFKTNIGKARYAEYIKAAAPIVSKYGGKKLGTYQPETAIIGELDADLFFMVEWPSGEVFQTFINDPEFAAIRHLREEALSKSLLIRCRNVT